MPTPTHRASGFTVVELLVALVMVAILTMIAIPAIDKAIHRNKMMSFHSDTAALMRLARYEAVKREVPAIVRLDYTRNTVQAFVDFDDDGTFAPDPSDPPEQTDYRIGGDISLPGGVYFWGAGDPLPKGSNAVDGFTTPPGGGTPNHVVLDPSGSVRDVGAFRFGDPRGNHFEIRVSPKASARIQIRKWEPAESDWFSRGDEGRPWRWF